MPPLNFPALNQTGTDTAALLQRAYGVSLALVSDVAGTVDLTPYLLSWSLQHKRGAPAQFDIVLDDFERLFVPFGELYSAEFKGDWWDGAYHVKRHLELTIREGGVSWVAPRLIMLESQWRQDADRVTLSLRGTDYSELLLQEDAELDDFISTSSSTITAVDAIEAILDAFGAPPRDLSQFDDYPLTKFSPKGGTPLDWIKQLLWPRQAEWYWDQGTFVVRRRNAAAAVASLRDIYHVKSLAWKQTTLDLRNAVSLRKIDPFNGNLASFDQRDPGFVDVRFTSYTTNAKVRIKDIVYGAADLYVWYDNDTPVSSSPNSFGYYNSPIPANRVRFQYIPGFGFPANTEPHISGVVVGTPAAFDLSLAGIEPAFTVNAVHQVNIDGWGRRKARTPIENQLLPNAAAAQACADLLFEESIATTQQGEWETILLPALLPASWINLQADFGGLTGTYYVDSVTKSGNKDGAAPMRFTTLALPPP